jgi:dihydrofolate synthase/folylpolyglutamate synthase
MSYAAVIERLNAMAPELYARAGQPRRKFSVDEVRTLLAALGHPQRRFPAVLIAGTNGKGSTASTLASILSEAGVRTGLYTSPHLARPNERIHVGQTEIADEDFARIFFLVLDKAEQMVKERKLPQPPSYFEMLTALGFLYFAERQVEIAVLEVGMGGWMRPTSPSRCFRSLPTSRLTTWIGWARRLRRLRARRRGSCAGVEP